MEIKIPIRTFLGENNAYCSLIDCTFNGNKAKFNGNAISDIIYEIENNTFLIIIAATVHLIILLLL